MVVWFNYISFGFFCLGCVSGSPSSSFAEYVDPRRDLKKMILSLAHFLRRKWRLKRVHCTHIRVWNHYFELEMLFFYFRIADDRYIYSALNDNMIKFFNRDFKISMHKDTFSVILIYMPPLFWRKRVIFIDFAFFWAFVTTGSTASESQYKIFLDFLAQKKVIF